MKAVGYLKTRAMSNVAKRGSRRGVWILYTKLALTLLLTFIYLDLPKYAMVVNSTLLPKYFYIGLIALLAPLLISRSKAISAYMASPFALWATLILLLNIVHLLDATVTGEVSRAEIIGTRIQYLALALVFGFAFSVTRTCWYERIFPVIALAIPCLVILDFLTPGVVYPVGIDGAVLGRGAGTLINPNGAGEAMLLTFLMACTAVGKRYRAPLLVLVGIGVVLTFSRAAIMAWLLLLIFLSIKRVLSRRAAIFIFLILSAVPFLFSGFENYLSNRGDIDASLGNIQARLNFFSDIEFADDSAQERTDVLKAGWNLFLQNPIFGEGAAATRFWQFRAGTHNQIAMLAAEYGILGIVAWAGIAIIISKGRYFRDRQLQHAILFLFLLMTMFTHNMFDSPYWLVTFALVTGRRVE